MIVPPYAGQNQPTQILVPATILYRQTPEEGPWVMPPYQLLYPQESGLTRVPPPVQQTDIFSAQQTFPL